MVEQHIDRLRRMLQRKMQAVTARRESAFVWRSGTPEDWIVAAELSLPGKRRKGAALTADERRRLAERDDAIADMEELDADALTEAIAALEFPGAVEAPPEGGQR